MSLLGSVLGGLLGGGGGSPMGSILESILGGGSSSSQSTAGQSGLDDLLGKLQRAGMGHIGSSWVGTGQSQPITPGQLNDVFGQHQVDQWSQQSGMSHGDILSQLSNLLPHAVDRMTPGGQVTPVGERSPFDDAGTELPPAR